ncbi:MAG: hypothetical protein A2W22_00545 [Candidatus Levybacteria bacterium RBG_16_35_11]|nr:MAG: hypothetical protein A2W22_00545 [Candidatus Levybacteria bacterium RBG_16_35_11]
MIIVAKCAPDEKILKDIERAGLSAVELYTNIDYLYKLDSIKQICKKFPFRYAVHAPNDGYEPKLLSELVDAIGAEIVVSEARTSLQTYDEFKRLNDFFTNLQLIGEAE